MWYCQIYISTNIAIINISTNTLMYISFEAIYVWHNILVLTIQYLKLIMKPYVSIHPLFRIIYQFISIIWCRFLMDEVCILCWRWFHSILYSNYWCKIESSCLVWGFTSHQGEFSIICKCHCSVVSSKVFSHTKIILLLQFHIMTWSLTA